MVQFLLSAAAAGGADASQLAHEGLVPGWALTDSQAMISPHYSLRLWELTEHALQNRDVALTVAAATPTHCLRRPSQPGQSTSGGSWTT